MKTLTTMWLLALAFQMSANADVTWKCTTYNNGLTFSATGEHNYASLEVARQCIQSCAGSLDEIRNNQCEAHKNCQPVYADTQTEPSAPTTPAATGSSGAREPTTPRYSNWSSCMNDVFTEHPYSSPDLAFLCGEDDQSPLNRRMAANPIYSECITRNIRSGTTDVKALVSQCGLGLLKATNFESAVCSWTVELFYPDLLGQFTFNGAPGVDLVKLCGETTSEPANAYNRNKIYIKCLAQNMERGVLDSQTLVPACIYQADLAAPTKRSRRH